jgi:hypothetical protein
MLDFSLSTKRFGKAIERVMSEIVSAPFVPVLTVMVDYGMAPFLWLVDAPDQGGIGGNVCDGTGFDDRCPMSEGLWRKFADWVIAFDSTRFFSVDFDTTDWDWTDFHERGVQLARWLKDEVGEKYRVVYYKPCEDPNHRIDARREILANGELVPLQIPIGAFPEPIRFCHHIVSGGQTGADRGALDFAIEHGYTHGGWAPHGREAEDGKIPLKYQLVELGHGGYRQRTRRNVEDSDATLIINRGDLDSGTLATQLFSQRLNKPHLVVQLDHGVTEEVVSRVMEWFQQREIKTLNVAGPRESKRPGIYRLTRELLDQVDDAIRRSDSGIKSLIKHYR